MSIKVLKPRQRELVVDLASSRDSYYLVARQISVPGQDKDLACKDKEGWYNAPRRSNALD
jgi:hypothetical protein